MRNNLSRLLIILSFAIWHTLVFAASFIATVENNQVTFGESIQLKLELTDAKATDGLDISALTKDFTIYHQQQFSTYSNVNGVVKAENGWQVTLLPKHTGDLLIPEISIATNHGLLSTAPIKLQVVNAKSGSVGEKNNAGISLVGIVNKHKAYVNEPIIYTLKIISYKPIANVVLDDIKSNDAIIEKIGDPKQYDQNHGGMRAHIIEIRYAVTALKAGKITIAPTTMSGELQVPTNARNHRFSMFNNVIFDNMFELKPFNLQSEEITLNILPAIGAMNTWLPLSNLALTQTWDIPKDLRVGETITRKIKMVGKGAFSKQLPSTKDLQPKDHVKVYASKPSFNDKFDENNSTVVGIKEEEYSIVPQADGTVHFPAVEIKWWNLKSNKLETAILPPKSINVASQTSTSASNVTLDFSNAQEPQQVAEASVQSSKTTTWYVVVGIVLGVFVSLLLTIAALFLWRKINKPKDIKAVVKKSKTSTQTKIENVDDLRKHILQYAEKTWQTPAHTTLNRLGDALTNNNYTYNLELYYNLVESINTALYANMQLDLEVISTQWEEFKRSVIKSKQGNKTDATQDEYSSLNPT